MTPEQIAERYYRFPDDHERLIDRIREAVREAAAVTRREAFEEAAKYLESDCKQMATLLRRSCGDIGYCILCAYANVIRAKAAEAEEGK